MRKSIAAYDNLKYKIKILLFDESIIIILYICALATCCCRMSVSKKPELIWQVYDVYESLVQKV